MVFCQCLDLKYLCRFWSGCPDYACSTGFAALDCLGVNSIWDWVWTCHWAWYHVSIWITNYHAWFTFDSFPILLIEMSALGYLNQLCFTKCCFFSSFQLFAPEGLFAIGSIQFLFDSASDFVILCPVGAFQASLQIFAYQSAQPYCPV